MDSRSLSYDNFERLRPGRPVDRLSYIAQACQGKVVLDIGGLDETAMVKRDTAHWLHGRIAAVATRVVGIDNSDQVPAEGIVTGPASRIDRGDATSAAIRDLAERQGVQVIVAGELIEHLEHPTAFLRQLKAAYPGRELLMSTPNGVSLSNTLMAMIGREVQHRDHLHNFTYKTLHTLCSRAGLASWEIVPYRFYATEMILGSRGLVRLAARVAERAIRAGAWCFPLTAFGYVVRARL